jgi:DNA-binding NarL/FixJ family response regulator
MGIRIVVADDHAIMREGLRLLLAKSGIDVVGEASNGVELVNITRDLRPQVVVADMSMPLLNGIDAGAQIMREFGIPCVLLTMHADSEYVTRAMSQGISGYVLKSRASACLVEAIREVAEGNMYLSPGLSGAVFQEIIQGKGSPEPLTPRERQVLQLIAEGYTTKEIAEIIGITTRTGESHRAKIMEKLGIHNTAGLVRYALKRGVSQL